MIRTKWEAQITWTLKENKTLILFGELSIKKYVALPYFLRYSAIP
jgi:hypothetical protein